METECPQCGETFFVDIKPENDGTGRKLWMVDTGTRQCECALTKPELADIADTAIEWYGDRG